MDELVATDILRAEVSALRIVVERLLGHIYAGTQNPKIALEKELGLASSELNEVAFTDLFDQPSAILKSHALQCLCQIYSCQVFYPSQQSKAPKLSS